MTVRESWFDTQQQCVSANFSNTNWLSSQEHCEHFILWVTYWRKNPHRFCRDYLKLSLHWYQAVLLYLMFHCTFIVLIAARASAKSYLIAIYAVCRSILYPNSRVVLTSGVRGQSKLIVTEKIQQELWNKSPTLRREIRQIKVSQNDVGVYFKCGSSIETVTCSDNALGHRSTVNVGEEAKTIVKSIMDRVISPFRIVRQVPFMQKAPYVGDQRFIEEPVEILISSSVAESHWLYKSAKDAFRGMLNGDGSFFLALDYSITLSCGIRTRKQMIVDRKKIDAMTWAVEYENAVLRENTKAYFTYDMVKDCMTLKRAFYPRRDEDVINKVKHKYSLPKQEGEIRIVAADIAAVNRSGNDNSAFSCLRLLPDADEHGYKLYKVQVPYIEAMKGQEMRRQAVRIRQLYEDFQADYIVLDLRNVGVSIYDLLARVLYDDLRGIEYPALRCMNDDTIAARINNPAASACIYTISASAKLNSDIAVNFKSMLLAHEVELLVDRDAGVDEIRKYIPEYAKISDPDEQLYYESPYLDTMLAMAEIINLQYEKAENTGMIKIKEQSGWCKDRYTSISYGCYFAAQLARDMLNDEDEFTYDNAPMLVSAVNFD